jgi:Leucine-rich repeat (LRR) protein
MRPLKQLFYCSLMLLLLANPANAQATVSTSDSLALVALYNATNGATWKTNTHWLTDKVNTWSGITVQDGRVFEVSLRNNNLTGTIPAGLGALTKLHTLALSSNKLTGTLPTELGNMADMQVLDVYINKLSGSLPASLGALPKLRDAYIGGNDFTGAIPKELGSATTLQVLYLNNCKLTGEIPKELSNLVNIQTLFLQNNNLTGTIPAELGELLNVVKLYLNNNLLTGEIPKQLGNLPLLEELSLMSNTLSGSIPVELTNLATLKYLYLAGNSLAGSIPVGLGAMPDLVELDIRFNRFEGAVPLALGNINFIQISNNNFTELPDFSSLPISVIRAENNRFTFEDIEPNLAKLKYPEFYSPQQNIPGGGPFSKATGESITFSIPVGGSANQYQWVKDGSEIVGATTNTYTIASTTLEDAGLYYLRIRNALVPELTLFSQSISLAVTEPVKQSQSITFNSLPQKSFLTPDFLLNATSSSGLTVTYSSSNTMVATVQGNTVSVVGIGSTIITATQPGNEIYLPAAPVEQTLTVVKENQEIVLEAVLAKNVGDAPFTVSATATSNLGVMFSSTSENITVSGNQITIVKAGQTTITASQPGNEFFFAAPQVEVTFCINPLKPVITLQNNSENPLLTSSNVTGNQWYLNNVKINGATAKDFEASEAGSYTVQTTVDQCASALSDAFVLVVTAIEGRSTNQLYAFPNPARDRIQIMLPEGGGTVWVLDQTGATLHRQITSHQTLELNVQEYREGLYLVKVITAKGNQVTKFIKH